MSTDNLNKINSILELGQLRRFGSKMLNGPEKQGFENIKHRYDKQRSRAEQIYRNEYTIRVGLATRSLQNDAGAKRRDFKPSVFGIDRFNKSDLNHQAQLNVRLDHQQTMDRLDAQELKESKAYLTKSTRREIYLEAFKKPTERRRSQTRRQSTDRRRSRSQTMSN